METNYDNTLFVRWLNDDLSTEELLEFKKSPKFPLYEKIAIKSSKLETIGLNEEETLSKIKSRISSKKRTSKTRVLFPKILYSAVASIAVLLGLFFFLNKDVTHTTTYGEQMAIYLPDSSEVILNANSSIRFKERNWNKKRTLKLSGEAYFKVKKGSKFSVETDLGNVTVLGTQFNTSTIDKTFDVVCYEGKVKVNTISNERILTKGNAFRETKKEGEDYNIKHDKPTWISGETTFSNIALSFVIEKIQNQYGVIINTANIDISQKITGSFTHNNINIALQTILTPLRFTFKRNNDTIKIEQSN